MLTEKFAVFILTHSRPNNIITLQSLKNAGYTGKVYLVIDNEDPTADEYFKKYGKEMVIQFDKKKAAEKFDEADTFDNRKAIVYARNETFRIAKDLGLDYFLQLDDDYTAFLYRWPEGSVLRSTPIRSFDKVCEIMLDFLEDTNALTVAFSQGGDHIGGIGGHWLEGLLRKAMNSFFVRVDRPIKFIGRLNEDVNAYAVYGTRGEIFLTTMDLQLTQVQTQKSSGGMTETYLDAGTYVKSFYTVMMAPSSVHIRAMGVSNQRLHHRIDWTTTYPKIISSKFQKPRVKK